MDSYFTKILPQNIQNKETAFTKKEREQLKLRGLLPPKIETIEKQRERVLNQFRSLKKDLDKYNFLNALKIRNETLFYNFLLEHFEEAVPIVYTPTVGDVCLEFGDIYRLAQGMYFCKEDRGLIRKILDNWTEEVDIIVVTDGSRILGLGDLGTNGMGIPIGKLSLYVAAAGFYPSRTLPILIDTGTNNKKLLSDPLYLGLKHHRLEDEEYYSFMDEFITAIKDKWSTAVLQFEDFSTDHAFELLTKYRDRILCFNDDIQGTGATIAAGFMNALKMTDIPIKEQRIVFYGAGSAGIGVAVSIMHVLKERGLSEDEAKKCIWMVDSKGLLTTTRGDTLPKYKQAWTRNDVSKNLSNLFDIVKEIKPNALIGLSGMPNSFTEDIVKEMSNYTEKPIIFALSNPTNKSEITAENAYKWTKGKVIFASGSPFAPVEFEGKTYYPSQGNNMYIFPGLGFGARLARAKRISDGMIVAASRKLADFVTGDELQEGKLYPDLKKVRDISTSISCAVIEKAFEEDLAQLSPKPKNILKFVRDSMFTPTY